MTEGEGKSQNGSVKDREAIPVAEPVAVRAATLRRPIVSPGLGIFVSPDIPDPTPPLSPEAKKAIAKIKRTYGFSEDNDL